MIAYIIRRTWQAIPTLIGVILLVFFLFKYFGGDPAVILAGKIASKEKIEIIRQQLGLSEPVWVQLWIFVKQVMTFDFGKSWSTNESVAHILISKAPVSFTIMAQVWILDAVIAVLLAVGVAYVRGSLTDRAIVAVCTAAMSISLLLYAVLGQYLFGIVWDVFPVIGWSDQLWVNLTHYAPLPVLLLLCVSVAPGLRLYRTFVLEEIQQDYVRTARAKGASEPRVMLIHVLRNAAVPIVTNIAMQLPGLLVGSFIIEKIFVIPGLGGELVNAVQRSDFPVIKAITIYAAMMTMLVNVGVDVLYRWLDPRVELK